MKRTIAASIYPLIVATAATALTLQSPAPASANSDAKSDQQEPRASIVAPDAAAPVAPAAVPAQPASTAEAPAPKPKPVPPSLVARIHLTSQTMVVQANGKTIHTWKVSSGAPGYATPPGTFRPGWMAKMWHSRQYDNAPMPHSVFFNGGIAVHGTTSLGNLGRAASHGCVRLAPANAARFYGLVSKHGMAQTRIIVHGAQPFRADTHIARAKRSRGSRSADGWSIVPSQPSQHRRGARLSHNRSRAIGYNAPSQPRRMTVVRAQSTYWTRY